MLKNYVLKQESCHVDLFSTLLRIIDQPNPMIDLTMQNLKEIKQKLKCDFEMIFNGRIFYNVKHKYESTIRIELLQPPSNDEIIRNFKLHFQPFPTKHVCRKTYSCEYIGRDPVTLRRHEKTCTDEQITISQQIEYGIDRTVIKRLVELGYLPEEALSYRKSFITTFDIESLENLEAAENLKNVEAVHKIASIAVSTNRGHSKCFIRENSSHNAVVVMIDKFLDFLDEINAEHDDEIPKYFNDAIENLQLMCSNESTLLKSDKMELQNLKNNIEKYLLHDIFGFNSGIYIY